MKLNPYKNLIQRVEGERRPVGLEQQSLQDDVKNIGYNEALDTIIKMLRDMRKDIKAGVDVSGDMISREAVLDLIVKEINIARTSKAGKTSRLTALYNKIVELK